MVNNLHLDTLMHKYEAFFMDWIDNREKIFNKYFDIMKDKLFAFIKHEDSLIQELLRLAERQQKALVTYDTSELQEITKYQNALSINLRKAEEQRINLLMNWLKISRKDAVNLRLSEIEKKFDTSSKETFNRMRETLKLKIEKLNSINKENRVLTNRAMRTNAEMLNALTKGNKGVLNAKV